MGHLVGDVDDAVGSPAPGVDDGPGLGGYRIGVTVHAAAGEQRLHEPALAQVVLVLTGQQPVAEGVPDLLVEVVVLAEARRVGGEYLLRALGEKTQYNSARIPGGPAVIRTVSPCCRRARR